MRFLLLLTLGATLCSAQQRCPWMNEATAADILDGAAKSSTTKGACEFRSPNGELRIEVVVTPAAAQQIARSKRKCGPNAKDLTTIGNEAVVCTRHDIEQVIGRVRDQFFNITLKMKVAKPEERFEKISLAAEQVSGNLF